jgi:ankyrin repeat protein
MGAGAMVEAVTAGDEAAVRRLLAEEPERARQRGSDGVSAVLQALYRGRRDLVDLLRPAVGPLDLHEAAALGDTPRLEAILQDDVDVRLRSVDGFTPLHLAAFFAGPAAVRLLLAAGADPDAVAENPMRVTPLHSAAAARDGASVQALLAAGATADAVQAGGFTPLMAAARNGDDVSVRALRQAGADPGRTDEAGQSARDIADPSVRPLLG